MSELFDYSVARDFDEKYATQLARVARAFYWVIVVLGTVVAIVAAPFAVAFMVSAPSWFWILAGLALLADFSPLRLPPLAGRSSIYLGSVCLAFAILLLHGPAPAILVEVVSTGIAARRLHLNARLWALLTARLVCSLGAAGVVAGALGLSGAKIHSHLGVTDVLDLAVTVAVYVAVNCAINVVAALMLKATPSEIAAQLRFDVLARASSVVLGVVIATTLSTWLLVLLVVPVVGWSQLVRMLAGLEAQVEHDPVTGLLSRQGLALAMLRLPREHAPGTNWFELVLIQLRGLKYVSRNFGLSASDHMINVVAARLRGEAGPGDLIGRIPGSHLVVLRSTPADEPAIDAARGFVRALSPPVESREGIPFRVDPVAGVAVAPQHGRDLREIFPNAEAALFDAELHRSAAAVYEPEPATDVIERLTMLEQLGVAVNDSQHASEITVLYQPQVSIATGRTESVEALLRWHHPDRGIVPTDELIRVVEPTAVMQQLTAHVVDRVVGQLAEWNKIGVRLRAAVNVSILDVITDDFDTQIGAALYRYGIDPEQLVIEITERSMTDDTRAFDNAAHRLTRVGVGLSLDDFGTGYASLRRLNRLPLTEVKIDRSYVSKIVHSRSDRAIVKAIHDLAHVLGLRIVAEGIEDEATEQVLATLDSVVGQGWHYGRPMRPGELVDWLHRRQDHEQ